MLEILLVLTLIIITYFIFKWVVLPNRVMNHYSKLFQMRNYKIIKFPFRPYSAPYYENILKNFKQKKDPLFDHKNNYAKVDVIITNLTTHPQLVIMNPSMIKEITSPEKIMILPKVVGVYEVFYSIFKRGIILTQKNIWKHRRRIFSKVFNHDFIVSQIPMMISIANSTCQQFQQKYWKEHPEKRNKEVKVKFIDLLVKYTSSVVISGFLGLNSLKEQVKGQSIAESIIKLVNLGMDSLDDSMILIFGEKLLNRQWRKADRDLIQRREEINSVLKTYITKYQQELNVGEKQNEKDGKNIIKLLLAERKKPVQQGEQSFEITDQDLIDDVKTFVIAGSDTTSNFLNAMVFFSFEKPEVAAKLRTQINSVIKSDDDITIDKLKELIYLDWVIFQTSRMFSSATGIFTRQLAQNTTIGGVPVRKGTLIDCSWHSTFYNPQIFQKPFEFIPERWGQEEYKSHQQLISMIFSGGPRSCLGKNLALIQMKVMMIKLMQRYDKVQEIQLKNRSYDMHLTYHFVNTDCILTRTKM